jgi:hypothetical protein
MFDAPSPVSPLARWHDLVRTCDTAGIPALLADEVVFHSPVVHTPQSGKKSPRSTCRPPSRSST